MADDKEALELRLREIGGCSDGNCIVVKRTGQHTNGGCRCSRDPYKMQQVIHAYKAALLSAPATPSEGLVEQKVQSFGDTDIERLLRNDAEGEPITILADGSIQPDAVAVLRKELATEREKFLMHTAHVGAWLSSMYALVGGVQSEKVETAIAELYDKVKALSPTRAPEGQVGGALLPVVPEDIMRIAKIYAHSNSGEDIGDLAGFIVGLGKDAAK